MDDVRRRGLVVMAGEALVDLVPRDGPDGLTLSTHIGGGPFTAARVAARLGAPVAFMGRLSVDRFGAVLRAALADDGVGLDAATATEDPTTLALAEVDAAGVASYRFYVDATSAPGLTATALPAGTAIFCVGTLGLVFEPSATALERLVRDAPDDVLVALDPNCRPSAIADPEAYRARLARILQRADLVKASSDDLAWLCPGAAPEAALRGLLRAGAAGVVTLGGHGALVLPPDGAPAIAVAAPPVIVADTIGAGDAFLGGLLARWSAEGRTRADLADAGALTAAARFACAVAARACARPGSYVPDADEVGDVAA